jgi:MFS family permease
MGVYGLSLAAATLVGYGLSGVVVSRMGYQALFLLGAVMLIIGAGISLLLPGTGKTRGLATQTSPGGGFKQVRDLLTRRGLTVAYCSIFAQYFTFGGVVTLLPLYAKGLGMEAFHIAMLMVTFAVMFIIIQLPSGALSDKIGRFIPIVIGLSLGIVSLIILPSVVIFPLLAAVMALYGAAYGILFPSISALVADHTIPEERGIATGMFHALLTAGVAIGAPVAGWVGEVFGIELGLVSIAGVMVLALVIAVTKLKAIPA